VLRAAVEEPVLDFPRACSLTQTDAKAAAAVVSRLSDWGLLGGVRHGRADLFGPSAAARRRLHLGQPDRRRTRGGQDDIEQAVLRNVAAHGRITRGQVSTEHGLGADQAKRLLAGLVARGLLERRGEGRGAYYESARKKRADARSFGRPTPDTAGKAPDSRAGEPGLLGRRKTTPGGAHTKRARGLGGARPPVGRGRNRTKKTRKRG
jgi:hypothetical protein